VALLLALACGGADPTPSAPPAPPAAPPAPPPSAPSAPSAPPVADPEAPGEWKAESTAEGDLNGDGAPDSARVLSREVDGALEAKLAVSLSTAGGPPTLVEAPKAVCVQCGGVKGAPVPFEVEIDAARGVLSLSYFGGSREVRGQTTKWRHQGGELTLIGVTEAVTDTFPEGVGAIASVEWDVNLSTRQMTETVDRVSGPAAKPDEMPPTTATVTTCAVPPRPPVTLTGFRQEAWETPRCTATMVE
jgi:hypothetical protein